jgi:site-specific DNA-methyltransferase (adenine-specific)
MQELICEDCIKLVGKSIKRVLKDDGSFFLNIGFTPKDPWLPFNVGKVLPFHLQNNIIWAKALSLGDESYGHFRPIVSKRFVNQMWENVFHFTKKGNIQVEKLSIGVPFVDKRNSHRWKKGQIEDKRCRGNLWFIPHETHNQFEGFTKKHPSVFPSKLPEWCIKLHGVKENMVVLDPFVGIGNTLIACKRLGIKGIGIDIDEDYLEIARNNLS